MRWGTGLGLVLGTLAIACSEDAEVRAQWKVVIQTDAPVPQFGDRLLVEVQSESSPECEGCRRQSGAQDLASGPVSFGVVPPASGRARVRARLYRSRTVASDGGPPRVGLIDRTVDLPPAVDGITTVHLFLGMSCFGEVAEEGTNATCDPATGSLGPVTQAEEFPIEVEPGSWPAAATMPCQGEPPADMRCIPGGAFLLGDIASPSFAELFDPVPERLVRLNAFALDEHEMTIETIQSLIDTNQVSGLPIPHSTEVTSEAHGCTYTVDPEKKHLPINCLSWTLAKEACEALEKRLPTEAEWEFAASGRVEESPFPWGSDTDICKYARVGWGVKSQFTEDLEDVTCGGQLGGASGPSAEGNALDVSPEGVRNLAGNLSEWVSDDHAAYTDACWLPDQHLIENPSCALGPTSNKSVRGASFASVPFFARVSWRFLTLSTNGAPTSYNGVRCAKSM